ncbi:hypothetical protein [Methanobrevibacter sp.]|uniref:hypothetical protein n=1 Tax=Methanobrevibacter sp. TaxID=66852 RepID=UPI0026DFCCB2|nr:hypothetical protein [Methanobrevibacter sp.]MDO5859625.1 hypothetical protein [Methanobrevibacter sp.]
MSENKITYDDIKDYEKLLSLAPSFLLERYAKKNTNLVLKFESKIRPFIDKMNDGQKNKLDIVLNSEIEELQSILQDAYQKSNKKQYKILANPKYRKFIEINLDEIREMTSEKN